jgi:D-arabinose 1-dehydrogenase-like Zn-dependent alcohol dehydrogenase
MSADIKRDSGVIAKVGDHASRWERGDEKGSVPSINNCGSFF